MLVTFCILPQTSTVIFRMFDCTSYDQIGEFLTADLSINCAHDTHTMYVVLAVIMIVVYPFGIPMTYFYLLTGKKDLINPPGADGSTLQASRKSIEVEHISFLFKYYRPGAMFFEVGEVVATARSLARRFRGVLP